MSWVLHIREKAKKILTRFPRKDQERIDETLHQIRENPYFGDLVKLGGEENLWRRRIGTYRIKFQTKYRNRKRDGKQYSTMMGFWVVEKRYSKNDSHYDPPDYIKNSGIHIIFLRASLL